VLAEIAGIYNREKIHWALGASMLLYFQWKDRYFHDIDLMTTVEDANRAKDLLLEHGAVLSQSAHNTMYKTKYFFEFVIDGVDIDLMAGMVIVHAGREEDCSMDTKKIERFVELDNETIPLYSLAEWRRFYEWMGREKKVQMIDGKE
jgi:hypothetical protein